MFLGALLPVLGHTCQEDLVAVFAPALKHVLRFGMDAELHICSMTQCSGQSHVARPASSSHMMAHRIRSILNTLAAQVYSASPSSRQHLKKEIRKMSRKLKRKPRQRLENKCSLSKTCSSSKQDFTLGVDANAVERTTKPLSFASLLRVWQQSICTAFFQIEFVIAVVPVTSASMEPIPHEGQPYVGASAPRIAVRHLSFEM